MNTGTKVVVGIAVALIVLGITCVGGIFSLGLWMVNHVPEGIVLDFEYPDDVVVGDEFDVTMTIENLLDERRTLVDVDFYNSILDGVSITSIIPNPSVDDGAYVLGSRTISFNRTIPAEGEIVLVFTMIAEEAGYFTGDVNLSIDGVLSIHTTSQTIVIDESED